MAQLPAAKCIMVRSGAVCEQRESKRGNVLVRYEGSLLASPQPGLWQANPSPDSHANSGVIPRWRSLVDNWRRGSNKIGLWRSSPSESRDGGAAANSPTTVPLAEALALQARFRGVSSEIVRWVVPGLMLWGLATRQEETRASASTTAAL